MKRILALILSVALVAALVPAMPVFAAAPIDWDNVVPSYNYHFTSYSFGETAAVNVSAADHTLTKVKKLNAEKGGAVTAPWGFVYSYGHASLKLERTHIRFSSYLVKDGDVNKQASDGGKVAVYDPAVSGPMRFLLFDLEVPKSGKFRPVIEVFGDQNNSGVDVYLIKKDEAGELPTGETATRAFVRSFGEKNRLGHVDLYNETADIVERAMPSRNLEAGEYYLALVFSGSNPNCVFNEQKDETNVYFGDFYVYNEIKGFRLDSEATSSDATEVVYDLKSTNFFLADTTATGEDVPEGFLPYIGQDSSSNSNRAGFGWLGKNKSAPVLRHCDAITNIRYIDTAKTAPWSGEYVGAEKKEFNSGGYTEYICNEGYNVNFQLATVENAWYPVRITVPYAGKYTLSFASNYFSSGPNTDVYFMSADINDRRYLLAADIADAEKIGSHNFYRSDLEYVSATERNTSERNVFYNIGSVTIPKAGDYYVIVKTKLEGSGEPSVKEADKGNAKKTYYYHELCAIKLTKTGDVSNPEGEALDAEYRDALNVDTESSSFKDRAVESAEVSAVAADVEGNPIEAEIEKSESAAIGAEYTVKAKAKDGYTFLYWAMGLGRNKRVVSSDAEYTFKPTSGRTWLTAIYRANDADKTVVVFFNGNREEIGRGLYNAGDAITLPSYPSMAGFGTAIGWVRAGKEDKFSAGDTVTADGAKMNFVAEYGEEITVNVTTNAEVTDASPKYGETVTATAPLRNDNADIFAYWEKDGKVVSFEREYSFKAWKNTTVNAVYKKFAPVAETVRKIILGNDGDLLMAEFILPEKNIIEKGVLFGESLDSFTHKVRMNGDGDYLSVINDISGTGVGYAILADGAVIYSK